jgi:hypothetical protein
VTAVHMGEVASSVARAGTRATATLFTVTSILTASLLFLVQPMVGRMVLPSFGGSPQVWTTAMLFFQTALLLGYGYTHVATSRINRRMQPWVHVGLALLPLVLLPIVVNVNLVSEDLPPVVKLITGLAAGVAAPFVLVSTSGPLLQRWFSWTDHPNANDPYFLYAAGNIGSIGGLLAYPFVIEPLLTVKQQSQVWTVGYLLVVLLLATCAVVVRTHRTDTVVAAVTSSPIQIGWSRVCRWLLWAFVPSSLMLAVTSHLSTDIAAVPMMWVLPLTAYLVTFTVAFSIFGSAVAKVATVVAPAVILSAFSVGADTFGATFAIGLQVLLVLVGGLIAHGRLSADRPAPEALTKFYVVIAVGGALGGLFNGIVAPLIFPTVFEYGLICALTLALVVEWQRLVRTDRISGLIRPFVALVLALLPLALIIVDSDAVGLSPVSHAVVLVALCAVLATPLGRSGALGLGALLFALVPQVAELAGSETVERTFFGVHRVTRDGDKLKLVHGSTVHGLQDMTSEESERRPLTYYHQAGPLGDVARLFESGKAVGVVGLGSGTLAAYGRPNQEVVFHEIDQAVVDIANDQFTYLANSPATVTVTLGDGRLTVAEIDSKYAALIVDAFTSDAIPVHLLTIEAIEEYLQAIEPDGFVAFNVSNRFIDLQPVLRGASSKLGLAALTRTGKDTADGGTAAQWVVLARDAKRIDVLKSSGWKPLPQRSVVWTDQRSSVWAVRK